MTKIFASALIIASALTLGAPAYAQRSANNGSIAASVAAQGNAAQRLFEQREPSFSSSNKN